MATSLSTVIQPSRTRVSIGLAETLAGPDEVGHDLAARGLREAAQHAGLGVLRRRQRVGVGLGQGDRPHEAGPPPRGDALAGAHAPREHGGQGLPEGAAVPTRDELPERHEVGGEEGLLVGEGLDVEHASSGRSSSAISVTMPTFFAPRNRTITRAPTLTRPRIASGTR